MSIIIFIDGILSVLGGLKNELKMGDYGMKRASKSVFIIITLLILCMAYFSVMGAHGLYGDIPVTYIKGINDIRWGIDIKGGVEATFSPADGVDATKEQMDSAKSIIEVRMVKNNITDYELYVDYDNDRVIVRFPWKEDEMNFDPEAAIEELSATALLTFRPGDEYTSVETDASGKPVYKTPSGETADTILLDGSSIKSASATITQDPTTKKQQYQVSLEFNEEGTGKFAEATEQQVGKQMSIWMDDVMLSAPTVNQVITEGKASITGDFTATEASELANKINAGALPFKLETINYGSISPTLGASALQAMGIAAVIALALICTFMIIAYKIPGVVACLAIIGQIAISLAAVSGFFGFVSSFTMTLPGVAGIILSIGMGADANIIMAERIKEELRLGKTLDGAILAGSKNSFSAIFDGNITVIIVAVILMLVFGPSNILSMLFGPSTTGTIYSFGYTLLIGVICNFIMGVGASRLMLKSISSYKFARNKKFYGGAEE